MPYSAGQHIRRIESAVHKVGATGYQDVISKSWRRSVGDFHIDPASKDSIHVMTSPEVSALREQSETLVKAAQPEIDRLYQIVRPTRYVVLLTDRDGVVIDHRGCDDDAEEFKRWGLWLGRVWSENIEGTNGIGTALIDGSPTTVHRSEHFRVRHTDLSCSGAPIFDPDSRLVGVIDVSCFDPTLSNSAHSMTGALTAAVARGIEERMFRARFQKRWIITAARPERPNAALLFAVDDDHCIVGANRDAREALAKKGHFVEQGLDVWTAFARNDDLFRHRNGGDFSVLLTCTITGETRPAIITPPLPAYMAKFRPDADSIFWRPRVDALLSGNRPAPADPHLGLAPATARRVRDFIEAHLESDLAIKVLADLAGLSVSHFARAFKQAVGKTPHDFVLERRLTKARQMLLETDLALSEIAQATGFADQSHFARRFRQQVGVAPNEFRKTRH